MHTEERFLKYVSYWTTSNENNIIDGTAKIPSTDRQFELAKNLEEELKAFGLEKVILTDHCYVYGLSPATPGCESKSCRLYFTYGYCTGLFR